MSFASKITSSLLPSSVNNFGVSPRVTPTSILTGSYGKILKGNRKCITNIIRRNRQQALIYEGQTSDSVDGEAKPKYHHTTREEVESEKIRHQVRLREKIRWMLQNMEDGEMSVSPYDTAWVALVEDISGGGGGPQFPTSLEWISKNQLGDGSWGDPYFLLYDRILNTLACVVALTAWNMHPHQCDKGLRFIRENIEKLEDEDEELILVGFEIALPQLIDYAKKLGIQIPYDSPFIKNICDKRDLKLRKIPMDLMHKKPTSLLFSLEGMEGLDWEKLMKLRSEGSFLSSPSSTAYALQHTKDELCLHYLLNAVTIFNGGVPNVYPVDMYEHLWCVDRLQRLGISRYFQLEIQECLDYVYRYWTNEGISWARYTNIRDSDDTAMGFRLLRMYGYDVSIDAFKPFEESGEFYSMAGQMNHAVTGMYNLFRASQLMFPQEHILSDARNFSAKFLHQKRLTNSIVDKWIITKDLPGEVGYALDVPFYASLPRLEARFFIEQYGGDDDVWIGKTLYRMPYVNSNTYLELAKLDYEDCQSVHQLEWSSMQKWYRECNLGEFGLSERSLLLAYYIAASTVFEPQKSGERLAWATTAILVETIASQQLSDEQKREFIDEFEYNNIINNSNGGRYKARNKLVEVLINTITLVAQGRDINQQLSHAWQNWLKTWEEGGDMGEAEAQLLLRTLHLSSGLDQSSLSHPQYEQLLEATSKVCHQLRLFQNRKVHDGQGCISRLVIGTTSQIEASMQEIVKLVFTKTSQDLTSATKQSFFNVARSFYYTAYFDADTIDSHIDKVLFQRIL